MTKVIEPGSAAELRVEYTAPPSRIQDRRELEVAFVEAEHKPVKIVLTAKVRDVLDISPNTVMLYGASVGSDSTAQLLVQSFDSVDWPTIEVASLADWLHVTKRSLKPAGLLDHPRQAWEISVSVDADHLHTGEHRTQLTVKSGNGLEQSVPVLAIVAGPAIPIPDKLFLGRISVDALAPVEIERTFLIRFAQESVLTRLNEPRIVCRPASHVKVRFLGAQDNYWRFKAVIAIPPLRERPNAAANSTFNGEISIGFDGIDYPDVKLPVWAIIAAAPPATGQHE